MASKPKPKRKGFDQGGQISSDSLGRSIMGGAGAVAGAYRDYKLGKYYGSLTGGMKDANTPLTPASPASGEADPDLHARGGKIRRVAGKPVGKDDGLISAQRGEYVVRKSAVNKLGTSALNTINRGKLPDKKGKR